jgi:hypothetical protein
MLAVFVPVFVFSRHLHQAAPAEFFDLNAGGQFGATISRRAADEGR